MLRVASFRVGSLAELEAQSKTIPATLSNKNTVETTQLGTHDVPAALQENPRKRHVSETDVPGLLAAFRCPVEHGLKALLEAHKTLVDIHGTAFLEAQQTSLLGHNGCALDADAPESLSFYLGAAERLVYGPYQHAPELEIGRIYNAAKACETRGKEALEQEAKLAAADKASVALLTRSTAHEMAWAAMESVREGLSPREMRTQLVAQRERLLPFAQKLVLDRARQTQVGRRGDTWLDFADEIKAFCRAWVSKNYPHVIRAGCQQVDKALYAEDPQRALDEAVTRALDSKASNLARKALLFSEEEI